MFLYRFRHCLPWPLQSSSNSREPERPSSSHQIFLTIKYLREKSPLGFGIPLIYKVPQNGQSEEVQEDDVGSDVALTRHNLNVLGPLDFCALAL